MSYSTTVLIVDESDLFRQTICTCLENTDDLIIVGQARDEKTFIEQNGALEPDVVLLGLHTLQPDAAQTVARISEQYPRSKILVLSAYDGQEQLVLDVFRKGAQGYLDKDTSQISEIVEAIHTISRGGAILDPGMAGWILGEIAHMRRQSETGTKVRRKNK